MSRSQWAWAKGCELVGAAVRGARRLGKHEVLRECLGAERPARTASSIPTLTWVATAVILIAAIEPAAALARSTSRGGRAPAAPATQAASDATVANTERSSDPSRSSGPVARGRTVRVELLAFGSGYAGRHGSQAVRALQRRLANLGYAPGPIDGRYGPLTEEAVIRFQAARHLHVDGIAGPQTMAAFASAKVLLSPGDGYVPGGSGPVRALQRHLASARFSPGPIDGRYGPLTEQAVIRLQAARHLHVDGIVGPQTLGQLERMLQRPEAHRRATASTPSGPHRPPRPPRGHTRAVSSHPKHATGSSPIPWVIVVACLLLATLAALVWRGRRGRVRGSPAADDGPPEITPAVAEHTDEVRHAPEDRPPGGGAFKLGQLLAAEGNLAAAKDAFRRADQRGHPAAAFELAVLMAQEGDWSGAERALRAGDDRGDADAAFALGVLLEDRGDLAGAELAYARAVRRGHAEASFSLGVLLVNLGDRFGAEQVFALADDRGDPMGACNHGFLLEDRGDLAGAKLAYRRAEERGERAGSYNLGRLLELEGDRDGAKAAYGRAEERGDPTSAYNLGRLLSHEGDRAGAVDAFRRATDLGPPEVAELALAALRELGVEESPDR